MSESSDKGAFTFTWCIENFSMCAEEKNQSIESPHFVVDALNKTTWCLNLFPKGDHSVDGDFISCFLNRVLKNNEPDKVTFSYDITCIALDDESCSVCPYEVTIESTGHGYPDFICMKKLSENRNILCPNDVLTVYCYMRWGIDTPEEVEFSAPLVDNTYFLKEISTHVSEDKHSTEPRLDNCTVTTLIPVERSEITWIIKDFKTQMQNGVKIPLSVEIKTRKKSTFLLHCYWSGGWDYDGSVKIDIERKDKLLEQMLLKCKFSVLDVNGTAEEWLEDQHLFGEKYDVWSFPVFIDLETLESYESELLKDGVLTLLCEFRISYKGENTSMIDYGHFTVNNHKVADGLVTDIRDLSNDTELSDVILISDGLELPVHKYILSARSPVFREMFSKDTEEKRSGIVRINDLEADTLRHMKSFMYGYALPDLQPGDAIRLYSVADKYKIPLLKDLCAASLKFSLSVSNMCQVLFLAYLHNDDNLKKYVLDFLGKNASCVFESAEWLNLMRKDIEFAAEIMRKVLTNQTNR